MLLGSSSASNEMDFPEHLAPIRALILRLDEAQANRWQAEWQASSATGLPPLTDPECPQSAAEAAIIDELTDPRNRNSLDDYVNHVKTGGPMNPSAERFFESLIKVAEKRVRGFE